MKKALKSLKLGAATVGIAVLAQGLGGVALGPLADATNSEVTAKTRVHVRTGPTTASKSLAVLDRGQRLPAHASKDGWTQVTFNGQKAYVASVYLRGNSVLSGAPASEVRNGTRQSTKGTVYTTAGLNLRTGPSLNDGVGLVVKRGTRLELTGTVSGEFAQVTYQGKTYWAAARYLSATAASAVSSLPMATGKARATAALMVRPSPTATSSSLGDAPAGTIFDVTGEKKDGLAQVIYNGAVRWVTAQYLTPVPLTADAPSAPSTPSTSKRYATTVLNIWAASTGSRYNGEIPRGGELQVTGIVENGRAQIVHNGELRWVTARYVSTTPPASSSSGANPGNGGDINKGYSSGLEKTNANVQAIAWDVWGRFPQITTQYGWRRDVTPDHPAGRAVDVMIPRYRSNQALGWEIANYYRANASKFNINYIIFGQNIWSVQRNSEGWRPMASRGNDTANHYDHVHINTYG
ncbi:SH3 domain-containing protein [Tessaracoccus massiliensis]|uniref:SH3 domain-containing protein n=1 Tax=Tessaracoccus massiliensis TaxID=1522311 RepID=UPI00058C1DDB|nr:SH3 domain-containing protein [Tessaracoccus massiliensis]